MTKKTKRELEEENRLLRSLLDETIRKNKERLEEIDERVESSMKFWVA